MCGIAGVLERSGRPVERELLQRMGDVIAHRGPGRRGPARRRPGRARQPPPRDHRPDAGRRDADGVRPTAATGSPTTARSTTSRELRAELAAAGHAFRSHTDTEVVLNAYAAWGAACVERFNGMFAFAIWDRGDAELFLARDRFGVKPLYYADLAGTFLFGSEIKSMLEHDALRARGQPAAPARVLHVPEHLHRRHAVRRRPAAAPRAPPDGRAPTAVRRVRSSTGTSTSARPTTGAPRTRSTRRSSTGSSGRRSRGSSSATSPSARTSAAAWTRAASPRWPPRRCPT